MSSHVPPMLPETPKPHFLRRMFQTRSWFFFWIPLAITCASIVISLLLPEVSETWENVLGIVFLIGLTYFFISMIVWFARKRPAAGLGALACMLVSVATVVLSLVGAMITGFLKDDTFAEGLHLPTNVTLEEPREIRASGTAKVEDTFQEALRASIAGTGGTHASIHTSIPSLGTLQKSHPDILQQYLAAHPAWRVYERSKMFSTHKFATRRWAIDGRWEMSLHGYYSNFHAPAGPQFQTRTTLGFSGKTWARGIESLASGTTVAPKTTMSGSLHESHLAFDEGGLKVELFEQAETPERRMTKATILKIEQELAPIVVSPSWATAKAQLPKDAITTGTPSFILYNSMQPGIYNAAIRCNPGEPGQIFLKAFEITKGTALSKKRLKKTAREFAGWSKMPDELFLSDLHFTIYEGDWGQYYGARFEVWFDPESSGPERKLLESNWKIEGWMH